MKSILKILTLIGLAMIPSFAAQASPLQVADGTYLTTGESHYKNQEFTLQSWGDGYMMSAVLLKDGREFPVEAFLRPTSGNAYSGSGQIISAFDTGKVCKHRFGTKFFVTEAGLSLRENTPGSIPDYPYGACTAAGPYSWFNHPEAYTLQ